MGLSNKREEQLKKMPYIETRFRRSKNGKYLIYQTVLTDIKPVQYYEKVLANAEDVVDDENISKWIEAEA